MCRHGTTRAATATLTVERGSAVLVFKRVPADVCQDCGEARGEADEQSDVDLLVDMEPDRNLLDMGGLLMELRELLGRDVDIVTERGLKPRIRARVLQEAIPL